MRTVRDFMDVPTLMISRKELEQMALTHAANELKAKALIEEMQNPKDGCTWTDPIKFATIKAYEDQAIKAKGFKECCEGLLYEFTGKMVNIDEDGQLIEHVEEVDCG